MTLPIVELPLYGKIQIETTSTSGAFSWVDHTQFLTGASHFEGQREITLGTVGPEVGTLSATFRAMTTVPTSGDYVRIRRYGTTEYTFTGYIQDVSQRIVFETAVTDATPVVYTTIVALDWVGLLTQVQIDGIDGRSVSAPINIAHKIDDRVRALNYQYDTTNATELIEVTALTGSSDLAITDFSGTIAEHLDIACRSVDAYWFANRLIPSNATTGRDKMVSYRKWSTDVSTGKTFTDALGSAGNLHYTEIEIQSSSWNVANTVNITNYAMANIPTLLTKIGGGNEQNFVDINGIRSVTGVVNTEQWTSADSTSVAAYGSRIVDIQTCRDTPILYPTTNNPLCNIITNGSMEYSDEGWVAAGAATSRVRRRQPSFGAAFGSWAMRGRVTAAGATATIRFNGGESDGTPVVATQYYFFKAYAARDTTSRTDLQVRLRAQFYDEDENALGVPSGTNVALTTAGTWYTPTALVQAPAGAVRVNILLEFSRSGGANLQAGDMHWVDGVSGTQTNSTGTGLTGWTYYDGDTLNTPGAIYMWTGAVGASQTAIMDNTVDTLGNTLTARFGTTSLRATRIRWNAQEDLTAMSSIVVGKTLSLTYQGTTETYRIIGIDGSVTPDRYMLDIYLWKV